MGTLEKLWQRDSSHIFLIVLIATSLSILSTTFYFKSGDILAYGDAVAHLNIAKRVIGGLTPGFGQLGSVWLPLLHIAMLPFIWNDVLWRTGLAGSFISMLSYILSSVYLFRTTRLLKGSILAGYLATSIFLFNPNAIYLQATPMGELPLIFCFIASIKYFTEWIERKTLSSLILSAVFVSIGTLIRYDAWFLAAAESLVIFLIQIGKKINFKKIESDLIIHGAVAYLGIAFWLLWNWIIFGNPAHFTTSQYSARHQQLGWLAQGKLITYFNLEQSIYHYSGAIYLNLGIFICILGVFGSVMTLIRFYRSKLILYSFMLLFVPYFFYVFTLFIGNSILLVPGITPESFGRSIFNLRYGLIMLPYFSLVIPIALNKSRLLLSICLICVILQTCYLYETKNVITYNEGTKGIASRKVAGINKIESWFNNHYDGGLVLVNTYYGVVDLMNINAPFNKIIYEGSYGYWQTSLNYPEKYADWILLRKSESDPLWVAFKNNIHFSRNFKLIYELDSGQIYKRKESITKKKSR